MRKPRKQLTSQQHATWSAAFLLAAIICTAIVFGQGDIQKAVAMIFMFFFGALCASHGAKSREKKALETLAQNQFYAAAQNEIERQLHGLRKKQDGK
jgi:Sec-independent protein secretion pathway component TatC